MSLIENARDFVRGLVVQEPEVGVHDTSARGHREVDGTPAATGASSSDAPGPFAADDLERLRREWETQPGHH